MSKDEWVLDDDRISVSVKVGNRIMVADKREQFERICYMMAKRYNQPVQAIHRSIEEIAKNSPEPEPLWLRLEWHMAGYPESDSLKKKKASC